MKRTVDVDIEIRTGNAQKALDKFFKKYPELDYWRGELEYMAENGIDYEVSDRDPDGRPVKDWAWALHFDLDTDHAYIAIIERA